MNLVLDFDGTITVKDTIGHLADGAIAFQRRTKGVDLQQEWDAIVKRYFDDLAAFKRGYRPAEAGRKSMADELCYLVQLREVEESSILRVEKAGLFAGMSREDLFDIGVEKAAPAAAPADAVGGPIAMRAGLCELLQVVGRQDEWRTSILSVNWSGSFIRGVLHGWGIDCEAMGIEVFANEAGEEGQGGGRIRGPALLGYRRLDAASDKGECLMQIGAGWGRGQESQAGERRETLYVGDSPTDLECLLYGRGVVIAEGEGSTVIKTLRRIGKRVPHVGDGKWDDGPERLVWARDFREILQSKLVEEVMEGVTDSGGAER